MIVEIDDRRFAERKFMPAIVLVEVTDRQQYSKYTQATSSVVAQFGGKFIVRGGTTATSKGPEEKRRMFQGTAYIKDESFPAEEQ